ALLPRGARPPGNDAVARRVAPLRAGHDRRSRRPFAARAPDGPRGNRSHGARAQRPRKRCLEERMMKPSGLARRIAVVTGAAVVRALADEGAHVAAFDLDGEAAERLAASITSPDVRVRGGRLDVTDSRAVEAAITAVEKDWGPIDCLANVAGVLSTTLVVDTDDETWTHVFDVNARGVFNVSRAVARRMAPRRRGAIVTVSSNAAGVPRYGMAAYAASKAAATMFTRCLGLELARSGIRCNIVAPGSTLTPMQTGM